MNMKKINFSKIWILRILWIILLLFAIYSCLPYILLIFNVKSLVVMSGSMMHPNETQKFFENYWQARGINPEKIPVRNGLNIGDLVILQTPESYEVGDVVCYSKYRGATRSIHRIWQLNNTQFRFIWDWCMSPEYFNKTIWVGVKDEKIYIYPNLSNVTGKFEVYYESEKYERCTEYWLPVSIIEGKAWMILPKAGWLYEKLNHMETNKDYDETETS
jgi:hypothetical protein